MNHVITTPKTYADQRLERLTDSMYEYIDEQQDGAYVGDVLLVEDMKKIFEEMRYDYQQRLAVVENVLKRLQ